MSSNTPPPGDGTPSWGQPNAQQPGRPDYLQGGPGGPPPYRPASSNAKRGVKALALAAVLAVVVAGGSFAFYKADPFSLFRAGPQAAEALPADALFYVAVDLDPSAKQKVEALRFLNHFPAFKDASGIKDEQADLRRSFFEKVFESEPCEGITYDDDIEPWIGDKLGIAGLPVTDGGSDPVVVGALEVTDRAKAEAGIKALSECDGGDSDGVGLAFNGDYAIVAETQAAADDAAASAKKASLADADAFTADVDSLGDLGVATIWVDIEGAVDEYGADVTGTAGADLLTSTYQRAAATFRFASDHVELVANVYGDTPEVTHDPNEIVDLPDSTVLALSEAGGANRLDVSWDKIIEAAKSDGVDIEAEIADFEAETGLSIPADLNTVLGDNLLVALDSDGLTADSIQQGDPSAFNLGARFRSNPDDLNAIYDKVLKLAQQETGELPFTKKDFSDGIVLASNDSYADTLSDLGGNLGDSGEFQSVTDDAADKEFVLYFNWDLVEDDVLEAAEGMGVPADFVENVRPIRAFGITVGTDGDYTTSTVRLSVND